jgi:hypothetical protein
MMGNPLINFLYWADTTLELTLMKVITHIYHIDNIVFNSVFRAIIFPYYIYKLYQYYKRNRDRDKTLVATWCDITTGILDQVDIIMSYIGFYGLSIGEYITFRTFSVFLSGLYLTIYYKKLLPVQKIISIGLIFIACVILLGFYNGSNYFYSLACVLSSVAYSLIGFLIELNVKTDDERELNFYWSKTISYAIALFTGLVTEFSYNTIRSILEKFPPMNLIIVIGLEILIALLENFYYYLKIKLISGHTKNGSIVIQFLDIGRRFGLIIIGILFFAEVYTIAIYLSLSLMFIGSLIGLFDYESAIYLYHKYIKKANNNNNNNNNSGLTNIEIVCVNQ